MPNKDAHNNEADAFRHLYMQAELTKLLGTPIAKIIGDRHENKEDLDYQYYGESNMDRWNNQLGRQIGRDVNDEITNKKLHPYINKKDREIMEDMYAKKAIDLIKNGKSINNIDDKRKFVPRYKLDKHGNLVGLAADIGEGEGVNDAVNNQGTKILGHYGTGNIDTGSLSDEFKTNTFDVLKKDSPYIDKTNTIDNFDVNKNSILPTKTNNSFTDLIKKSSALNNNVSIDNQDLIAENSTLGGFDNNFINKVKGKKFQDLSDEERLKAIWNFVG